MRCRILLLLLLLLIEDLSLLNYLLSKFDRNIISIFLLILFDFLALVIHGKWEIRNVAIAISWDTLFIVAHSLIIEGFLVVH